MTTTDTAPGTTAPAVRGSGRRQLSWHGVRTVATLELRQRVRSTRWVAALVVWFVVVGGLTLLISGAASTLGGRATNGAAVFAGVVALVLGLGLLVTPTLASTAVNGDRAAGTLATLQVTLLTPAEIVVGKVLAAWAASCAFLAAGLPFLVFAALVGPTPWWAVLRVVVLVAVLLLCVCGIGLGFSALVSRPAGSTVLTFATVATLVLGLPVVFGLTLPSLQGHADVREQITEIDATGQANTCVWITNHESVVHTERTWWLLAPNPFVVLADGAATSSSVREAQDRSDPLGLLRGAVDTARAGAGRPVDQCAADGRIEELAISPAPVWPWGLAVNVLLGGAGLLVAVRRLALPLAKLPRGTRVA
jgi:ABC-type transport system involved in multi-copper enzyme maturation permease subunit